MNGSTVLICGTGISQQEYREAVRSREGLDWICGPCLVDINGDSGEDDDTHIDQLGRTSCEASEGQIPIKHRSITNVMA